LVVDNVIDAFRKPIVANLANTMFGFSQISLGCYSPTMVVAPRVRVVSVLVSLGQASRTFASDLFSAASAAKTHDPLNEHATHV
jgi:hypothetical protein